MAIRQALSVMALALALALALAGCGAPQVEEAADPVSAQTGPPPAESRAEPVAPTEPGPAEIAVMPAGQYCYLRESDTSTEGLEITVSDGGIYSGRHYGTVHDQQAAYFTAFETKLTQGSPDRGGLVTFQAYTEVDGDTQTGEDGWIIMPDAAHLQAFADAVLAQADCAHVAATVWPVIAE